MNFRAYTSTLKVLITKHNIAVIFYIHVSAKVGKKKAKSRMYVHFTILIRRDVTKPPKCKVNTIPILMHQMRISTNEVSSVVLGPKKMEVRKKM